jgi:Ca2+-binding EF-hand superfamily protein
MITNALTASVTEAGYSCDEDERDIRQAFEVLDVRGDKSISVQDLQTIYLGLGYLPPVSVEDLQRRALQYQDSDERGYTTSSVVTIDTTVKILRQVRPTFLSKTGCPYLLFILKKRVPGACSLIAAFVQQCRKQDRCKVIEAGFRSIDEGNKGYLDARDVQGLAKEASGREISSLRAEHMISYFWDSCDNTGEDQAKSSVRLSLNEFQKLLQS